jgi:hypothetical protein
MYAVMRPLSDEHSGRARVPLANFGRAGIVRCRECRGYINPYASFTQAGKSWRCNMCGLLNDTPAAYYAPLQASGKRVDMAGEAWAPLFANCLLDDKLRVTRHEAVMRPTIAALSCLTGIIPTQQHVQPYKAEWAQVSELFRSREPVLSAPRAHMQQHHLRIMTVVGRLAMGSLHEPNTLCWDAHEYNTCSAQMHRLTNVLIRRASRVGAPHCGYTRNFRGKRWMPSLCVQ